MSVYVKYLDYPVGAQEDGTAASSEKQSFSSDSEIMNGVADTAWATLEPGVWALDGTRRIYDTAPAGWWSLQRSDDNGEFSTAPTITVTFTAPYTATGLTFQFSPSTEQYCSRLTVAWYNDTTLLAETTVQPDSAFYVLSQTVESFDKIVVTLLATNKPNQFAKLEQLTIGQIIVLDETELVKVNLLNELDPSITEMSVDEMTLEINDRHERDYAPQENQTLELYVNGELRAAHYLKESTRTASHYYTFKAQSIMGLLDDDYMGGIYSAVGVSTLLNDILGDVPYSLDSTFADVTLSGYLPICTRREALLQVAIALGALVTTQGGYNIRLLPLPDGIVRSIPTSQIFTGASVQTSARIARVDVFEHSYIESDESEELIKDTEISGDDVLYTFADPHHGYEITGGTISSSGANWAKITASGTVTLTGKKYIHATRQHSKSNPMANSGEKSNIVQLTGATLVGPANADNVLTRLYNYYLLRQTLQQEIVAEDLRAGELVMTQNIWGGNTRGYITSMESTITRGAVTASVTIIGEQMATAAVFGYAGQMYANEEVLF